MRLLKLRLKNFRSYDEATFHFSNGVNIIAGPNATGKTTLLEAIYLLISGHSFRTTQLTELIKHGKERFFVEACYLKHGIEQKISLAYGADFLKVTNNAKESGSLISLFGALGGVVMTPDDAALVKGSPQVRRRYLDLQIAQVDPLYIHYAKRYKRALKQRNALLRRRSEVAIDSWEQEMAQSAAYISHARSETLEAISGQASLQYQTLSGEVESLAMQYVPSVNKGDLGKEGYALEYRKMRGRELMVGYTLKGPHKDDFAVNIGDHAARYFGSEGQQRSCIAAMRLAEWIRLEEKMASKPLMLVDDIAISLDKQRSEKVYELLARLPQVFLTTTEENPRFSYGEHQLISRSPSCQMV